MSQATSVIDILKAKLEILATTYHGLLQTTQQNIAPNHSLNRYLIFLCLSCVHSFSLVCVACTSACLCHDRTKAHFSSALKLPMVCIAT